MRQFFDEDILKIRTGNERLLSR